MLLATVVAGGACAGGEQGTTPSGDRVLTAVPDEIKVNPNETGTARFVLTSGGVPIAGQRVTFSIVDGSFGDDDLTANGTIVDQGGPAFPAGPGGTAATVLEIPTLSQYALMLLALLLATMAGLRLRSRY